MVTFPEFIIIIIINCYCYYYYRYICMEEKRMEQLKKVQSVNTETNEEKGN